MFFDRFRGLKNRIPSTKAGERVYAIGDVHGRFDLLRMLLDKLEDHNAAQETRDSLHVVLLGDLIDRGPDSARVLRFAKSVQEHSEKLVVLKGNHEILMLGALDGVPGMMRGWLRSGGDATLRSFDIDPDALSGNALEAATQIAAAIPDSLIKWVRGLPLTAQSGDYLFCHAGIRPGIPIAAQKPDDLLWIRNEFLLDERDHGVVVVHGHSIEPKVDIRANRIGIDTGAYASGVLTALCLRGKDRDILTVSLPSDGQAGAQADMQG